MANIGPTAHKSDHHLQTERRAPDPRALPALLFARRLVESAFADACQTRNGQPTECAQDAIRWLEARTDWTLRREMPIPPADIRREFYASFEWACRLLQEHPDHVREHGLPAPICRAAPPRPHAPMQSRIRRDGGPTGQKHIRGLPHVHSIWEAAKERHAQKTPLQAITALPAVGVLRMVPGTQKPSQRWLSCRKRHPVPRLPHVTATPTNRWSPTASGWGTRLHRNTGGDRWASDSRFGTSFEKIPVMSLPIVNAV